MKKSEIKFLLFLLGIFLNIRGKSFIWIEAGNEKGQGWTWPFDAQKITGTFSLLHFGYEVLLPQIDCLERAPKLCCDFFLGKAFLIH